MLAVVIAGRGCFAVEKLPVTKRCEHGDHTS
jgi:hypothetical protein